MRNLLPKIPRPAIRVNRNGSQDYHDLDDAGLIRVDDAIAVARPANISKFYVQDETNLAAREQRESHRAAGIAEARDSAIQVGRLKGAASDVEIRILASLELLNDAKAAWEAASTALGAYVRRAKSAAKLFYISLAVLFFGDIAGIAASSNMFGIPWVLALPQAVAVAGAAVTAGRAGAFWRDLSDQRDREMEKIPTDLDPYKHLFSGPSGGESYTKIGILFALSILILIFGGIFALQSTEGFADGLVFACLGAAVGMGSFVNYWHYRDQIADLIATKEANFKKISKATDKLSSHPVRLAFGAAKAEHKSIMKESTAAGEAAASNVLAKGMRILRENPGVAGHGPNTEGVEEPPTLEKESATAGSPDPIILNPPSIPSLNGNSPVSTGGLS
jgi:hypothetical protein